MNTYEQQLLKSEVGALKPRLTLRTGTYADVGLWWRRRPLWLCVLDSELLLLAIARRRYSERVPLAACNQSYYSPSSGELVIKPDESLRFPRLKMSASDALEVLNFLNHNSTPNTTTPNTTTP